MPDTVTAAEKKSQVKQQPCFAALSDEESSELASLFKEVHFKKDDVIVTQGDSVDSVFIIISGTADVKVSTVKDGQLTSNIVATLGANQAVGLSETGFYSLSGRRTATVIAKDNMVTLKLSVAAFNGFALANHHVSVVMRNFATTIEDKDL